MGRNPQSHLGEEQFRRLTGVEQPTFRKMLCILRREHRRKKAKGGSANALSVRKMLLMTLEYLREYRTYFHIAVAYRVSESTAYRVVRWTEDTLIKDGTFSLPGRKELLKSDADIEVVLVDVAETPVQRPKKNNADTTQARRNGTR